MPRLKRESQPNQAFPHKKTRPPKRARLLTEAGLTASAPDQKWLRPFQYYQRMTCRSVHPSLCQTSMYILARKPHTW